MSISYGVMVRGREMFDVSYRGYGSLWGGVLCFLDTETTGLGDTDVVIEVCARRYECGVLVREYVSYVSLGEGYEISEGSFAVHGIGRDCLVDAPGIMEVSDCLRGCMDGSYVVGYNSTFDMSKLLYTSGGYEYGHLGVIDLYGAAKSRYVGLKSYSLRSVCGYLGIGGSLSGYHSASEDVGLLVDLWKRLSDAG